MCSFHTYAKRVTMWNERVNLLDYNHHFTMYIKTSCCIRYNQYTLQPIKNKVGFFVCAWSKKEIQKQKPCGCIIWGLFHITSVTLPSVRARVSTSVPSGQTYTQKRLCYPFPHLFYPMTSLVCYSDFGVF